MDKTDHPMVEVCLTVDVEGDINGAFMEPERQVPLGEEAMWRHCGGHSHGLGFLLESLATHELTATFFLELFQSHRFGLEPLHRVARAIAQGGAHELALHLHPCWQLFSQPDWPEQVRATGRPKDSMAGLSAAELDRLLTAGVGLFHELLGHPPHLFRGASLEADRPLFAALARAGIKMASCIGSGYRPPEEAALRLLGGAHTIAGVLERPVTSYRLLPVGRLAPLRLLTLTGTTWYELAPLLEQAWRQEVGLLVLLTHPAEFARKQGLSASFTPHRINQERWQRLCRFLATERSRFPTVTMTAASNRERPEPLLCGPWLGAWQRWRENRAG